MKRLIFTIVVTAFILPLFAGAIYAGSDRTWGNIGKGLAIYEGIKVLTGREGNIVDDVTGGMKPRGSSSQAPQGGYEDGYNAGFKEGYEKGYNAGFKNGVDQSGK
jgi:hypothetical protein